MNQSQTERRQSFLQFHVPLRYRRSRWYLGLTEALNGIKGLNLHKHFHITAAFITDYLDEEATAKVADVIDKELKAMPAPSIVFDTVEAFTGEAGTNHYVCLATSQAPNDLTLIIDKIRMELTNHGYRLGSYRLHVTLADIPEGSIDLESLQARVGRVSVPTFTLTLAKADYRFHRDSRHFIREWTLCGNL